MTRHLLLLSLLGGAALLAPGRVLAQEKPSLNTTPGVPTQPAPAPAPQPSQPAQSAPLPAPTAPPAAQPLPTPSYDSPSGFELPQREQERKAAQQHAEMYSKLFVYTGLGLGYTSYYGTSQFNFSISPAIGYRVTDKFSIGPGISYSYNNYGQDTGLNTTKHVSTSSFGVKVFAQYMVYKQFFAHAEYETTRAEFPLYYANGAISDQKTSYQVQTPLLGVGYRSQISTRAAADILLLYNFKDNYESIYPNPVIRFNFLFNIGH